MSRPPITPPTPAPEGAAGVRTARLGAILALVAILAWLSFLVGIAILSITGDPWCGLSDECTRVFWPRLSIGILGALGGFFMCGFALLFEWQGRRLLLFAGLAVLVAIVTGVIAFPMLTM